MASDWVLGHGLDFPGTVSCALVAPGAPLPQAWTPVGRMLVQ